MMLGCHRPGVAGSGSRALRGRMRMVESDEFGIKAAIL